MKDALTLSDVLTRRLSLQWHEGIAIVRGVAEHLLQQQGVELRIPELHQIQLVFDGSVALAGGGSAKDPMRRLGQLLQALLNDAEVPVQLRLVISQATAPIPSYASIAEFDEALAYFERPDRPGTLKALYARAAVAEPLTTADGVLTLDDIAPLPQASGLVLVSRRPRNLRRLTAEGLALTALVALATFGTLYARSTGITFKVGGVSRVTVAAADAVGLTVMTAVSAASDRAGLGRLVPADEDSPAPGEAVRAPVALRAGTKLVRRGAVADRLPPVDANDEALVGTVVAHEVPPQLSATIFTAAHETSTSEKGVDRATAPVYSAASQGVAAPVNVRQQLPGALPPMVDRANLSRIEIVIAPDGSVESARLLDNRPDVLGGMFLSAVKAWEFHPALKDGVAVRYRKIILVSFE